MQILININPDDQSSYCNTYHMLQLTLIFMINYPANNFNKLRHGLVYKIPGNSEKRPRWCLQTCSAKSSHLNSCSHLMLWCVMINSCQNSCKLILCRLTNQSVTVNNRLWIFAVQILTILHYYHTISWFIVPFVKILLLLHYHINYSIRSHTGNLTF